MTARTTLNVGDLVRAGDGEAEILGISTVGHKDGLDVRPLLGFCPTFRPNFIHSPSERTSLFALSQRNQFRRLL
jgi:hypothetical protein